MATFTNASCNNGGVKPTDPLLFTCKIYASVLLRIVFPTGYQEIVSAGDTAADVDLPPGFNVEFLNITTIDESRRNFHLTLSIDKAIYLDNGYIMCDDTTTRKRVKDVCPIGKLSIQFFIHNI